MYKYKQTTNVKVNDLVVWTELPSSVTNRVKDKVYMVIGRTMGNSPLVVDETGLEKVYGRTHGFKVLQTKPADQAVVGDYMYRITSGSNTLFPKHTVIKITRTHNDVLGYSKEHGVGFEEVIVIAQAEPEIKYPLFMYWSHDKNILVKFDGINSGTCLTTSKDYSPGEHSLTFIPHTNHNWKPCDFTIEPEIFDIDWWQARYEAGLPVYAIDSHGIAFLCKNKQPKQWYGRITFSMTDISLTQKVPMSKEDIELFKQQVPLSTLHSGLCQEISLGATADCSLLLPLLHQKWKDLFEAGVELEAATIDHYPLDWFAVNDYLDCGMTIGFDSDRMTYRLKQTQPTKEQPMKLQQLLDTIFGVSDYEAKPKFIVTVFNNDKEVGTTTAESIEEIQQTIQSDTRLWGCKLVAYKIHSELQTQVPVAITKFKNESNAPAE